MKHLKVSAGIVLAVIYGVLGGLATAVSAPFVLCRYLPAIWRAAGDARFGGAIIIHQRMSLK